jgi:hypothetical protein
MGRYEEEALQKACGEANRPRTHMGWRDL